MTISFRTSLLLIIVGLLGLTVASTLWAVLRATDANARANAERELEVAEGVVQTLLLQNSRQLTDRTTLLAEDFGFKRAIATNEEDTIISALANHGDRVGADLIVLMQPDGGIQISTHTIGTDIAELRDHISAGRKPFSMLTITENQPYQLVMVPVAAPELIAWVGMGFVMDIDVLQGFRNLTKADVTLLYQDDDGDGRTQTLSTLPGGPLARVPLNRDFPDALNAATRQLNSDGWLSRHAVLTEGPNQRLGLMLSVSLEEALAAYNGLQTQMLAIAALALLLAGGTTVFIARGITRPIDTLVGAARRIASGDYSRSVALQHKNEFGMLGDTLNAMQEAIQERERRIRYQAQYDLLTGLPNRDELRQRLVERLESVQSRPFGVALVQVANFDALSDVYGISIMDRVLQLAAQRLGQARRPEDCIGRVGTDEFLILCENQLPGDLERSAQHYIALFAHPFACDSIDIKVELRVGLVACPEHACQYEDIMRRAHVALGDARARSRVLACYETGRDESHLRKITVTHRLQQAIGAGGFELLFQPQYNLHERRIHSAEALIRWNDPELGRMFPDEFIPLAEQSGDITLITDWVVATALSQMLAWRADGIDMGVSINLSARDLLRDDFIDHLLERVDRERIPRELLMLEVTESAVMVDSARALRNLQRLKDAGISLAMDDFGTGFSSLAQLKAMPIHELKIDKSFVMRLDEDADDQRIVRSTIEMAHHLGLSVIAEGVENQAALTILREMGCDAIQGYFLSRPVAVADLKGWVRAFDERTMERLQPEGVS